jgi:hypothetical protein
MSPTPIDPRLARYEESMEAMLGYREPLPPDLPWGCRLLYLPTFHPPCVIQIVGGVGAAEIEIALLVEQERHNALFSWMWAHDAATPAPPEIVGRARCAEDLALVEAADLPLLQERIARAHAVHDRAVDHGARDGITICGATCVAGGRSRFRLQSPQWDTERPMLELLVAAIGAAQRATRVAAITKHLQDVTRYLA